MPLPDERPRQSVANLIGRFEKETKRQSLSASSPSRSSSVVSHATGDSTKEEVKEKREWPPKAVENVKPPIVIPTPSFRHIPPALDTKSLPNPSSTADTSTNHDKWKKDLPSAQSESEAEVPLTAKALNASQRQVTGAPNSFLENWRKDLPSSQAEMEPEAPATATEPTPEKQPSMLTPTTASVKKFGTPATPRSSNAASKAPAVKSQASKAPASTPARVPASITSKAVAKAPAKSPAPKQSLTPSSYAQPLRPQHTGQSVGSTASTRRPIPKATPSTPSRSKTPSGAKTPTSARPKTPSTGLFAPTAASLARSRNAAPQLPTPTKKPTLSSSSMDRLSKPTAASLSKARIPTSTIAPRVKGKSDAPISKAKKEPVVPKAATGAIVAATVAGIGATVLAAEVPASEDISEAPENGNHQDSSYATDATDDSVDELVEEPAEDTSVIATDEAVSHEESGSVSSEEADPTPMSPSPAPPVEPMLSTHETQEASAPGITVTGHELEVDDHKAKDELADIVNLLESVSITKTADTIPDIPDEILDIPDEEEK